MLALNCRNEIQMNAGGRPKRSRPRPAVQGKSELNPLWQSLAMRSGVLQRKLTTSQADDPYEREADRVADQVMRMPAPQSEDHGLSITPVTSLQAQRKCSDCEDEEEGKLQRKESGGAEAPDTAPPIIHEALNSPGQPLDENTRAYFEPRFGYDFSQVRVHTGARASESARAVNALAYTTGRDVVFGTSLYTPHSTEGRRLLAHELTHVMQQRERPGESSLVIQRFEGMERLIPPPPEAEIARQWVKREAARQVEKKGLNVVLKAGWRHFWKAVIKRFALRGATAAALAVLDTWLPIGDLIALGLLIWTIWDIINLWDAIWQEAEIIFEQEEMVEPEEQLQEDTGIDLPTQTDLDEGQDQDKAQDEDEDEDEDESRKRCCCRVDDLQVLYGGRLPEEGNVMGHIIYTYIMLSNVEMQAGEGIAGGECTFEWEEIWQQSHPTAGIAKDETLDFDTETHPSFLEWQQRPRASTTCPGTGIITDRDDPRASRSEVEGLGRYRRTIYFRIAAHSAPGCGGSQVVEAEQQLVLLDGNPVWVEDLGPPVGPVQSSYFNIGGVRQDNEFPEDNQIDE